MSADTMQTISNAIAEYGHMADGEKFTLGDLANAITSNLSKTDQLEHIVQTLMKFPDKYIEDLIANDKPPNVNYWDHYAIMPPEWTIRGAVTGQFFSSGKG